MMTGRINKMNCLVAGLGLALVVSVVSVSLATPGATESIANRLQQYAAHFNRGDADAIAALFSEDVIYYGPTGDVYEGREAVRGYYQGSLEAGFSDMTIEAIEIRVFGDIAYDVARYTISDPGGNTLAGYHLAILAKEGDQWIVQRTLVNAVMPESQADQD